MQHMFGKYCILIKNALTLLFSRGCTIQKYGHKAIRRTSNDTICDAMKGVIIGCFLRDLLTFSCGKIDLECT